MRWAVAAAAALLLLAGCQKSFDERYAEAQKHIGDTAGSIDKELSDRASEAAMGEAAASEAAASASGAPSEATTVPSPRG